MPATTSPIADPAQITLADPDGNAVRLKDLAADPLVVILVRYFGCLPCQEFVCDVDARREELPAGTNVVAIGGSADYQAQWLRDEKGVTLPLLIDADQQVRDLADVGDLSAGELLSLQGASNYVASLRKGWRPQRITRDAKKAPGAVILGPDLDVLWTHRGQMLGDYPTVDRLFAQTRSSASQTG